MFIKKLLPALAGSGLLLGAAVAGAEISGNVALTTDYKFRGISQSDESPAIQGGFDYEDESGFYIGTWGSSVDFDSNDGFDGSLELDVYLGFGGSFGDSGLGYDIGFIYYDYPGDDGAEGDYQEIYGSLSVGDFSLGLAYSDDYYGETGKFYYVSGDYEFALPEDIALGLHIGFNSFDEAPGFLSSDEDKYYDYSISISKSLGGVDLSLAYVGTDLDEEDVFDTTWGDAEVIFTISKSL